MEVNREYNTEMMFCFTADFNDGELDRYNLDDVVLITREAGKWLERSLKLSKDLLVELEEALVLVDATGVMDALRTET